MIPDGEAIVAAYLQEQTGERVLGRTPADTTDSWVRLTQLDAANEPKSKVEHLVEFYFQAECYAPKVKPTEGTGQAEASTLARTVRAALHDMPAHSFDGVVVTQVRFGSMPRIPDEEADEPARERYILDTFVRMHPK